MGPAEFMALGDAKNVEAAGAGPDDEGAVTVMVGILSDAAAASLSFCSFSAFSFSFSNLTLSCRSFSCLSLSICALSAAAMRSLSDLSFASLTSLSFASFSFSIFLFASRTFMIALASNSCFSHFENTFVGVRGLPFVLSDNPGVPGESALLT